MLTTLALSLTALARTQIEELVSSQTPRSYPVIVFEEDVNLPVVTVACIQPDLANEFQEDHEAKGEHYLFECDGLLIGVVPSGWDEYLEGKTLDYSGGEFRLLSG